MQVYGRRVMFSQFKTTITLTSTWCQPDKANTHTHTRLQMQTYDTQGQDNSSIDC